MSFGSWITGKAYSWFGGRGAKAEEHPGTDRPRRVHGSATIYNADTFMKIPPFPMRYSDMYEIAKLEPVTRTCIHSIRQEIFRRGLKWIPKWTSKCPKCGLEYTGDIPQDRCGTCDPDPDTYFDALADVLAGVEPEELQRNLLESGKTKRKMMYPDKEEYRKLDEFLKCCNSTGQSFLDVIAQCEDDINVVDDAYLVLRKDYLQDKEGNIAYSKVKEALRGSPALIRKVIDQYNRMGGRWWKCIGCGKVVESNVYTRDQVDKEAGTGGSYHEVGDNTMTHQPPRCKCGRKMHDVHYFEMKNELGEPEHFYIDGEVIHWQFYAPSSSYGTPPMITLYVIQAALIFQNIYIRDFFEKRKIPPGFMSIITSNPSSFWSFWNKAMLKWKTDKQYIPVAISEADGAMGKSGGAQYVKIMDTLAEMQYTEAREEMRMRIAAFYGVSPTFLNDGKQDAGTMGSSEGHTLVVTNRTVEAKQRGYNQYVFATVTKAFGVKNWSLEVEPSEDRDIVKQLQQEQIQLQNCQMLTAIGFEVDVSPNGDWIYWKPPIPEVALAKLEAIIQTMVAPQIDPMTGQQVDGGGPPQAGNSDGKGQSFSPSKSQPSGKGGQKQEKPNGPGAGSKVVKGGDAVGSKYTIEPIEIEGVEHFKWVVFWPSGEIYDNGTETSMEVAEAICQHHLQDLEEEPVMKGDGMGSPSSVAKPRAMGRTQGNTVGQKPSNHANAPGTGGSGGKGLNRCHICGQNFESKQALGGHMKTAHSEEMGTEISGVPQGAKIENLNLLISDLLVYLSRKSRPTGKVMGSRALGKK